MLNIVVLTGRLTREPELKYSQSGVPVCRFTLAVNRSFGNANGEREADFPNIVTFRKIAENVANHLHKGSLVGVEGRIQTSSFDGKDGNRVFLTEVIANSVQFLEPRNSNAGTPSNQNYGGQQNGNANTPNQSYSAPNQTQGQDHDPFSTQGGPVTVSDDDLPF